MTDTNKLNEIEEELSATLAELEKLMAEYNAGVDELLVMKEISEEV